MSKKHPQKKLIGPIHRLCSEVKFSMTCDGSKLWDLDWSEWWMDGGCLSHDKNIYLHVRKLREQGRSPDHDTWHRVHPKRIAGRHVTRISVKEGFPYWLHDLSK